MKIAGKTPQQWMFTSEDQIAFIEQWRNFDEYGLSTKKMCLALIENGTPALKAIGKAGLDAPANNKEFTDILYGWLPEMIIAGIAISRSKGVTQDGLKGAIKQLQGGQRIVARLAAFMAFPFAVTISVGFVGTYVSSNILNASRTDHGIGQSVLDAVTLWGGPSAIGCVALLLLLAYALPNWKGESRNIVSGWPLFSVYKYATATTILDTLANLISCGMKLDDALQAIENNSHPFIKDHVSKMRMQKTGQENLGLILDTGLLLPFELTTLKVLGSDVDYHELLKKSAVIHQDFVNKRLDKMKNILPKVGMLIAIMLLVLLVGSSVSQLFATFQF